ncbi:MAG: mechanosensitive ion channel family protein [Firmicutes bacterium]|nr:mechanosensitive ion channel family protein [Bacillota bacterium]
MINGFLHQTFFHNRVLDYLILGVILVLGSLIIWSLKRLYFQRSNKGSEQTEKSINNLILNTVEKQLLPLGYFGVLYVSMYGLNLKPIFSKGLNVIGLLLITFFGVRFILSILEYSVDNYFNQKRNLDLSKQQAIKAISNAIKIFAWALAIIIILDNFGIKISALMTGLGIGGVAVALASQAVLGDIFNYFTIFFDRPFAVGDFIIVGEFLGTVEHIGIKTTRLRSLGGEQLVFSNTDLTNSRVRNYKRMQQRRVLFQFKVTYDTPIELLEEIPVIVRGIIEGLDNTVFDRAHFFKFDDFSLVFEVVYYVLSSDYNRYMDIQQEINLRIMQEFKARSISFAITSQKLYLHQQ